MDGQRIDAEDRNQQKDNRDIHPNSVPRRQPFIGHDESHRRDSNDDLEVPDLEETLSMLEEQGN